MAAGTILGILGGLAGNAINRSNNSKQNAENYKYANMLASANQARAEQWYLKYSTPAAMLQQYKEAGLSPGLMYENNGASGQTVQGNGSMNGQNAPQMDVMGNAMTTAQMRNLEAQTENTKADTEGKKINNANDPVVQNFEVLRQQTITAANDNEAKAITDATNVLQSELTKLGLKSISDSINVSKSEGKSGSITEGWSFGYNDSHGESQSSSISSGSASSKSDGKSVNAGMSGFGGTVGASQSTGSSKSQSSSKGSSESHTDSYGENKSSNTGKTWGEQMAESMGISHSESKNYREVVDVLNHYHRQCKQIIERYDRNREEAERTYERQVKRYTDNLSRTRAKRFFTIKH